MDFGTVRDNLARVAEDIARIQAREGISHRVTIVGVTKGHPAEAIRVAADAGLEHVGENRVQEALKKQEDVGRLALGWHLIGHLQTNKAKSVPGAFDVVHSVDSEKLATALANAWQRWSGGHDKPKLDVFVQVNVAGEDQKSGCAPEETGLLAKMVGSSEAFRLRGLMTMAPQTDDEKTQREVFANLRSLRERLLEHQLELPELSMGMSSDYRAAVAEGSTMVRLGTVLFGARRT